MTQNKLPLAPEKIGKILKYQANAIVSQVLFSDSNLNITLFAVAKGQKFLPHITVKKAIVHMLEGKGSFMLKNKWHNFSGGEYFYMPPKLLHALKAASNFKFILYLLS